MEQELCSYCMKEGIQENSDLCPLCQKIILNDTACAICRQITILMISGLCMACDFVYKIKMCCQCGKIGILNSLAICTSCEDKNRKAKCKVCHQINFLTSSDTCLYCYIDGELS